MANLDFLTKQYGPLPGGAWLAVVGGGLGIAWYTTRHQGTAGGPVEVTDTSGVPGVGDGSVGGWDSTSPGSNPTTGGATTYTTNEDWGNAAIRYLIAKNYDAATSDSAIRKYLAGNEPNPSLSEYALQGIALAALGPPPSPLPPSTYVPPTQATPAPTGGNGVITTPENNGGGGPVAPSPVKGTWVVVEKSPARYSTLWGIAVGRYGSGAKWPIIYNANRIGTRRPDGSPGPIVVPNLIQPGWHLFLPDA